MLLFLSQGIWGGLSAIPQGKKKKKKFHCCVVLLLGFSEYILYQSSFFQIFFFPFSLIFKFFFPCINHNLFIFPLCCWATLRSTHQHWSYHLLAYWQLCFYSFIFLPLFQFFFPCCVLFPFPLPLHYIFLLFILLTIPIAFISLFDASFCLVKCLTYNRSVLRSSMSVRSS